MKKKQQQTNLHKKNEHIQTRQVAHWAKWIGRKSK